MAVVTRQRSSYIFLVWAWWKRSEGEEREGFGCRCSFGGKGKKIERYSGRENE